MPAPAQIEVTPSALADLTRLDTFLRLRSPGAADRLQTAIFAGFRLLRDQPRMGRPRLGDSPESDRREWLVRLGRSTYIVLYKFDPDQVTILRIHHGREDRGGGLEG